MSTEPRITISGGSTTFSGSGIRVNDNTDTLTLNSSTVSGNTSSRNTDCGAGIWVNNSNGNTLNIYESTISGNTCSANGGDGGGLYFSAGTVNIRNSTFYGNQVATAAGFGGNNSLGGAIYMGGGTLAANFVSFSNNRAQANQGADIHATAGTLNLQHSFLVNPNTAASCFSAATDTVTDTLVETNSGGGNACGGAGSTAFTSALTLGSNGGPTQTLAITTTMTGLYNAASACTGSTNIDQRGTTRPQGASCDRGAFELVVNTAPAGTDNTVTTNEDAAYTFAAANFGFTDSDAGDTMSNVRIDTLTLAAGSTLQLSGTGVTAGQVIPAGSIGNLAFTPALNANGAGYASFTFSVQDTGGLAFDPTPNTMTIAVTSVNDAPGGADNAVTISEDASHTFAAANFGLTDPNDSPANTLNRVRITTLPGAGTLILGVTPVVAGDFIPVASIPSLSFVPASNGSGAPYASFTFQVEDSGGTANGGVNLDASPNTFTFNVTAVNDAPALANMEAAALAYTENQAATAITASTTATDIDSTNLTGATIQITGNYQNGEDILGFTNQNGITGTWTAATGTMDLSGSSSVANYQTAIRSVTYQNTSENPSTLARTVSFTVTDGTANSNTVTRAINVTAVNDVPACSNVSITTNEDTTGVVLPNCTDVDNPTLTYTVGAASNGTSSFVSPNLSYAPNLNFTGADSFTYYANDGTANSNTANVSVTVNLVNDAPVTANVTDTTTEDIEQTVTLSYTDEEGDLATSCSVSGVANGSVSTACACNVSGVCTVGLTPSLNSTVNITANYTVSDGTTSNASTITLSINPVNDAPSFTSTEVSSATQDVTYTYNVTTTDPDAGDALSISITTLPSWLTFVDHGDRTATLSGTPTNADVGTYSIELVVADPSSATASQSFQITVSDVNDLPSFTSVPVMAAGESTLYTYNIVTTDPDLADTLTITAPTLPTWLTLVDNGNRTATLSGTPNSSQVGAFPVVLQVTDGGEPVMQEFDITVGNTAPEVINNSINSVPDTGDGVLANLEVVRVGVTQLIVPFNQDVYNVTDTADSTYPQSVSNPANYMLVRDLGDTADFQTVSCADGAQVPADTNIEIGTVTYNATSHTATFTVNGGLPLSNGNYRLFVCGTTSIVDIVDNTLELAGNGTPGTDFIRSFTVAINANGNTGGGGGADKKSSASSSAGTSGLLIPVTGFAPDQVTALPTQPADKAYKPTAGMRIEVPTLGIDFPIVGASLSKTGWDLTWLQNNVAYLEGSAYPTWTGNTVLTAHVTDANNNIGPFSDIKGMRLGQYIYIHSNGQTFVYAVQENRKILPSSISTVFEHEDYDWITLVTCEDYNAKSKSYQYRRMVRAVLISVIPQK